jgi:hypothetical protein
VVDVGVNPMMNGGEEVLYGVQQRAEVSILWTATICVSRGDDEVRLESAAALVVVDELVLLQEFTGKRASVKARERERGCMRNRGESQGLTTVLVSDGFQWRSPVAPAKNFRSLAAQI